MRVANPATVAVIGDGASATVTAAQLLRHAAGDLNVTVIGRSSTLGKGVAYGTTDRAHLLNVVAGEMSAFPDQADHFQRWAGAGERDYVPRTDYGRYLGDVLTEARSLSQPGVQFRQVLGEATSVRPVADGWAVSVGDDVLSADAVVLATGNGPPTRLPGDHTDVADPELIVADPWAAGALAGVPRGGAVLAVGTGLTFVDVALTLAADGHTNVVGISRHGLVPREHQEAATRLVGPVTLPDGPVSLARATRLVRSCDPDWRTQVDSQRSITSHLWRSLSEDDRLRFVAHLSRYWEVARHRMPPATARTFNGHVTAGRVRIERGRVTGVGSEAGVVTVTLADGRRLSGDALIACTGPTPDPRRSDSALLTDMFGQGLLRAGSCGLGPDLDPESGCVVDSAGFVHRTLVAVGPPRRGTLWEATAMPEIRGQAEQTARWLLRELDCDDRAENVHAAR